MNKQKLGIGILVAACAIVGLFLIAFPEHRMPRALPEDFLAPELPSVSTTTSVSSISTSTPNTTKPTPSVTTEVALPTNTLANAWVWMNTYKDSFGYSISHPDTWSVGVTSTGLNVYTNSPDHGKITIQEISGSRIIESSGKWGEHTYYYEGQTLRTTGFSDRDGKTYDIPVTVAAKTIGGLPILVGAIRSHGFGQFTYVVPVSTNKWLRISGAEPESPTSYSEGLLYNLVRTVQLAE